MNIPWPNRLYAWWVAFVLVSCFTVAYIDRQIISLLVVPIQSDLGISDTQFSLLQGIAFALFYTLMGIPLGRLADTYNRRNIITVCIVMWTIMTAMCGLASSFLWLFLARVGVGIGEGGYSPNSASMLSDYFPPEKLTLPIGLLFAGSYIGGGIAFMGGGALIDWVSMSGITGLPLVGELKPWQLTFIIVALPGFLLLPLIATVREPIRRGLIDYGDKSKQTGPLPVKVIANFLWERRATYLLLALGVSLFVIYVVGATVWAPAYFIRVHGWSESEFGLRFGSAFFVFGIAGTFSARFIEYFFERSGHKDAKLRTIILAILVTLPVGIMATTADSAGTALVLYSIVIFLVSIVPAIAPSAILVITPNQMRGQIGAVYGFILSILGIGFGPTFVALITDYVYGDPASVGKSLATTAVIMCTVSLVLLVNCLKFFRQSLIEAEAWKDSVA